MFFIVKGKANAKYGGVGGEGHQTVNHHSIQLFPHLSEILGKFTKILIGWFKLVLSKLLSEKFTLVSLLRFRYHEWYNTCLLSYSHVYGFKKSFLFIIKHF